MATGGRAGECGGERHLLFVAHPYDQGISKVSAPHISSPADETEPRARTKALESADKCKSAHVEPPPPGLEASGSIPAAGSQSRRARGRQGH
ncbi:hypothetical protein NDU88_004129 [Pleurodeles waltl]|uniref:Uncharacterized protein n=1 Tax=Pleurodeles waltl TaxID=8319 RepID=A0AAV7L104_PLEWA|nr:hypothetical protein NDU88_004129 [Pleurodeles waltl]